HAGPAPRRVADQVVAQDLDVQPTKERVVTHPVGHQMTQPGDTLRAIVIGARDPDRTSERLVPVHALRGLRHAERIRNPQRWVAFEQVEGRAVGADVEAAPALDERDDRGDGQGALPHGRHQVSDLNVAGPARGCATDLLGVVGVGDLVDLSGRVARWLGRAVLGPLARRVALRAETPRVGHAHDLVALVREGRPVDLLDRSLREARRLLDQIEQHAVADDPVAALDRTGPAEIRAAVHRMDTGQATDVPGHDAIHREQDRRRSHAGPQPERIAIADAGRPVPHGIAGGDLDVRLGARYGPPDTRPQLGQGRRRDDGKPGQGVKGYNPRRGDAHMEYRSLGSTGLRVSALGFGCGNIGGLLIRGSVAERERAVARAMELGINYFDTAASYGDGQSEENLGRALRALKASVLVGTKV